MPEKVLDVRQRTTRCAKWASMTSPAGRPVMRVGLQRIREHCLFTWEEPEGGGKRIYQILRSHCPACVAEVERLARAGEVERVLDPTYPRRPQGK